MKKHFSRISALLVNSLVLLCMIGCTLNPGSNFNGSSSLSEKALVEKISSVIDNEKGTISKYLAEDLGEEFELELQRTSSKDIASKALGEENGRQYLDFVSDVSDGDVDTVLKSAKGLMSNSDYQDLLERKSVLETELYDQFEPMAKELPPNQRDAFFKDLKKLVVKSVVLLTAGIVYAAMPKLMIWGKVGAAAGISIAAGAVAVTVLAIYDYYKNGGDADQSFDQWLNDVIELPKAEYAIATAVMATGATLQKGPVVSGIVLCVFAIYKSIEIIRPMLKKYNFNA